MAGARGAPRRLGDRMGPGRGSAEGAAKFYEAAVGPRRGFMKATRVDPEGFKNTLKLRAELDGRSGGTPPPPERYFDLSY